LLPFRSLDPFRALREPDRRRRDEERLSSSEQRTGKNQKPPLDRKSPIQVRIHLSPAESRSKSEDAAADLVARTERIAILDYARRKNFRTKTLDPKTGSRAGRLG